VRVCAPTPPAPQTNDAVEELSRRNHMLPKNTRAMQQVERLLHRKKEHLTNLVEGSHVLQQ